MIAIVAAVARHGLYSVNGKMPWEHEGTKLRKDLRHFQQLTTGNIVMMGRKTFESLGSKPLPQRTNIVVSKQLFCSNGVLVERSLTQALALVKLLCESANERKTVFIVGGAQLWSEALPLAEKAYITEVHKEYPAVGNGCQKFFPALLDLESHSLLHETKRTPVFDEQAGVAYDFVEYTRAQ